MDVDSWPVFMRFNQNTSIQKEVAERIARIYDGAGFKILYYDGAEDVNKPYWYNIGNAQLIVYNALKHKHILAEVAAMSHFSWHILSRGNAFDTFYPKEIKDAVKKYAIKEIEKTSNDFTSIDFGWINYVKPGIKTTRAEIDYNSKKLEWFTESLNETTIGVQPDMLEYVESLATSWNCPVSLVGNLEDLRLHPRNSDNMEVLRRWEDVKINGLLTKKDIKEIKNGKQEHILLIDENGNYELQPYKRISKENSKVRAFLFHRKNKVWVVYWHISGDGFIELPIGSDVIKLYKELGEEISLEKSNDKVKLPVGSRKYIQFELNYDETKDIFSKMIIHE